MVERTRSFLSKERNISKLIFSVVMIAAFVLIFGGSIKAQFMRVTGSTGWGYGYGYGYGYGGGFDGGIYAGVRTDGDPDPSVYEYNYGFGNMVVTPVDGVYTVTPSDMGSLVEAGVMSPNGSDPANTTQVTFNSEVELNVATGISVNIPSGTTFTSGSAGNFTSLAANSAATIDDDLHGVAIAGNAMSFGIPNLDLTVNPAITISITVGTSYNGQTLNIYRKDTTGGWNDSGTTCLVSAGVCSFTTTHLSSFATGTQTSSTGGSTGGGGSSSGTLTPPATETPAGAMTFRAQEVAVLSSQEVARRVELMKGTYAYQLITQSAYPAALAPNATTDVWIEVKNVGTATWFNNGANVVRLGSGSMYGNAIQQRDYASEFANSTWYSANRPANILHPEIIPGWHTRFQFTIKAPSAPGVYKAYFTPVVDGMQWMNDIGIYWQITVQ